MSNGLEIMARLPNPNAGPAFYIVASEVATHHFLRDKMGIPIPRIYDWSAETCNPVGAEYILEEKATGQPLGNVWANLTMAAQLDVVNQVVDMEKKIVSISFPKHGCLYYEKDLKPRALDYEALDSRHGFSESATGQNDQLPAFVIGPSFNAKLWKWEKAAIDLDRGPWESVADYAAALAKNEIDWASSHARQRIDFHRYMESLETPNDYITLIKHFFGPCSIFGSFKYRAAQQDSHPDLHLDNVFIDPETNRVTCIIDWQHTSACPISLQRSYPQMLELSSSSHSDQSNHKRKLLDHYYNAVKESDPARWEVLSDPLLTVKTNPYVLVTGCWHREELFSLRNALIAVIARWGDMGYGEIPCPVHFSEELLKHQHEMDLLEGISTVLHELQDTGLIPLGGMVHREYYEHAMELNDYSRRLFIDLAENERHRELHVKVWPYQ
ncbi:hypothetical protein PENFLA_c022G10784 [Penicillium flavigenum]|uniref:Uncharacterized protein n=1 Tax=Penicillium flavigenum TaxID=254877 RepID=A0A1V6SVV8_9EURO|nr:hypothetical protein PENFLA_c022G10784 [Penicillium flavigenum]